DAAGEIGGQFNLAKRIPGKEEFYETLRYFRHRIGETGVDLQLGRCIDAADLQDYDEVVLATGVTPRHVDIPGVSHPKVVSYLDVLAGRVDVGKRAAIIGAGGIGFDVAEFLAHHVPPADGGQPALDAKRWMAEWGIDASFESRGGVVPARHEPSVRQLWLLQRSAGKPGARLGKTTGWIHRATLKAKGVKMIGGIEYLGVDDRGLRIRVAGAEEILAVDHVVICAGQESRRDLLSHLQEEGRSVHVIGGADRAVELDAKRAIAQGSRLASIL
ncbi:MAG: FAD-dependent oxidoreductase, partial [Luteimonas sp.]